VVLADCRRTAVHADLTAAHPWAADDAEPVQSFLESGFVRKPGAGAACRRALETAAISRVFRAT
jgi:hypothetical protein